MLVWVPPEPARAGRDRRDPPSGLRAQRITTGCWRPTSKPVSTKLQHTALMDRLRARIKDKRVCALVKAFLKSGVLTELGDREETLTGTPQGGILSPLLANIALSALDDHFDQQWQQEMGTRRAAGQAQKTRPGQLETHPLCGRFRPHGVRRPASRRGAARGGGGRARTAGAAAGTGEDPGGPHRRGLRRSSASTSAGCGNEERRSTTSTPQPSRKAIQSIKDKVKAKTYRSTRHMDLDELIISLNQVTGGMGELLPARGVQGTCSARSTATRGAG